MTRASSMLLALAAALIMGCTGGSIGTDNPSFAASVQGPDNKPVADSVHVKVWKASQNPILEPRPVWDTVIQSSKPFRVDPSRLGLDSTSWNIEAISDSGTRITLLSNLSVNAKGSLVRNGVEISDTMSLVLMQAGSVYTYSPVRTSVAVPDTSAVVKPDTTTWSNDTSKAKTDTLVRDTLQRTQSGILLAPGTFGISIDKGPGTNPDTTAQTSALTPSYLVVLGTSVIMPFTGTAMPDGATMNLPPGTYVMVAMDSLGKQLSSWQVTVSP